MLQPKVGDLTTIKGIIVEVGKYVKINTDDFSVGKCQNPLIVKPERISSVEEGPLKVGDTVWYDGANYEGGTLLFIHEDTDEQAVAYGGAKRQWGVVAYKGDMPKSFYLHLIRKTR